jgi:ATP-dependent helicase/nuclease subunit A
LATDAAAKAKISEPEAELMSLGDPRWFEKIDCDQPASGSTDQPEVVLQIRLRSESQSAPIRGMRFTGPNLATPKLELGSRLKPEFVSLADAFSVSHSVGSAYDTLIHALFARVEWLESFNAEHESMRRIARARLLPEELRHLAVDDVLDEFLAMLNLSSVNAALSRSRYQREVMGRVAERVDVDSQRPINALVDGTLIEGSIDRLAVLYQDGKPYAAEIFDFKVDAFDPKMTLLWLDDRVDYHRPQLELYAQVVAQQLQIPRTQVATYLLMLATDDIVRVDQTVVTAPKMHTVWPTNSSRIPTGR